MNCSFQSFEGAPNGVVIQARCDGASDVLVNESPRGRRVDVALELQEFLQYFGQDNFALKQGLGQDKRVWNWEIYSAIGMRT